jgi:HAE1 family hydrophobic/amphiphilic exporter-1
MKDAKILFFTPPSRGLRTALDLKIEDKGNDDWQTVSKVSNEFLGELMKRLKIQYAITNFNPNFLNIKWILMSSELRMRV